MKTIEKLLYIKRLVQNGLDLRNEPLKEILEHEISRNYLFECLNIKNFNQQDFIFLYKQNGFSVDFVPTEVKTITINGNSREIIRSWAATSYLKKASVYISTAEDDDLVGVLREIIYAYITYILANRSSNIGSIDDSSIGAIILSLPLEFVFNDQNFEFIRQGCLSDSYLSVCTEIIEVFYPRVLEKCNRKIALQTIKLLFDYEVHHHGFRSVESKVQEFHLKEFVSQFATRSFLLLGPRLIKLLFDFIEDIQTKDNYAFSSIYINSLFSDIKEDYFEKFSVIVIEFLKIGLRNLNPDEIAETLKLIKYYDEPIFNRLGIFIVGLFYENDSVRNYFWKLDNPINNPESDKEVKFVINKYRNSFKEEDTEQFTNWVNNLTLYLYNKETDDEHARRLQYQKDHWFNILHTGLLEQEFSDDESIFQSVDSIPSEAMRITNAQEEDIVPLLISDQGWGRYNQSGIITDIRQLDSINRQRLLYGSAAKNFLPEVLWALITTFEIDESRDWSPFFELVEKLTKNEKFWNFEKPEKDLNNPEDNHSSNYNKDLWRAIADVFRQAASHRKASYFNYENCVKAIALLIEIEPKAPNTFKVLNVNQEYLDAITTVKGSIYEALISLSVSMAVIKNTKEFYAPVTAFFREKLNQDNLPKELLWVIGGNLVKIGYMNISWIETNKKILFESEAGSDLKVLKTHLLYTTTVYKDLYFVLQEYYEQALLLFTDRSNYTGKLIQHICISNASGWPGSHHLMDRLFSIRNPVHFHEMIKHFNQQTGRKEKRSIVLNTELISTLWQRILTELEDKTIEGSEEMAFNLLKWVENFEQLSEGIVILIYRTLDQIHNYPFDYSIMRYFKVKSYTDPRIVGEIINSGLLRSNGFDLTGYLELINIGKNLYENGASEQADKIVKNLVDRNLFFLVDLYENNHVDDDAIF